MRYKEGPIMLGDNNVLSNIAVKDIEESKKFYGEVLGLKEMGDKGPMGVLYASGPRDGRIFMYKAPTAGTGEATVCTWEVDDIKTVTDELGKHDVKFEHYEFPGATHDGPVHVMGDMKSAWFSDPSGNILGLSEGSM